mgnify:CR=1 FL=1
MDVIKRASPLVGAFACIFLFVGYAGSTRSNEKLIQSTAWGTGAVPNGQAYVGINAVYVPSSGPDAVLFADCSDTVTMCNRCEDNRSAVTGTYGTAVFCIVVAMFANSLRVFGNITGSIVDCCSILMFACSFMFAADALVLYTSCADASEDLLEDYEHGPGWSCAVAGCIWVGVATIMVTYDVLFTVAPEKEAVDADLNADNQL